jgi:3-hydroxyacyl-[acyl-carrier-protein] dehydratase
MPLMPGVIMCEAAAQLASYATQKHGLMPGKTIGFGGLKDVRFRGMVQPGERFVVVVKLLKIRSMMLTSEFQCLVRDNVVCEGELMGIPLPDDLFQPPQA